MTPEWPKDQGRRCEFWDWDYKDAWVGELEGYVYGHEYPWISASEKWRHCKLVGVSIEEKLDRILELLEKLCT